MSGDNLSDIAQKLRDDIANEADPRKRMQLCRQALGLGRTAVKTVDDLADNEIKTIQSTLRMAHRNSKGIHNPNTFVTKLAKTLMDRAGVTELAFIAATRPKVIGTESACFAISGQNLPEGWWDTMTAVRQMNEGQFFLFSTGADGWFSLTLRLLSGEDLFLDPKEYKNVLEASPDFHVRITSGTICFGSAERTSAGTSVPAENGRYVGNITSLRSKRGPRLIATLIRSERQVDTIHQTLEMKEL